MGKTLEGYVAEATKAYEPSRTAIQNQLDALNGQLENTNEQINRNYAQQQAGLNRQRNMAAETASMQAAGSGGSFGGASNLANRKYYDQTFVPAVTQLRTNQSNDLAAARQANENERMALNTQLAGLESQANQHALAQYYSDLEAEKNRALQQRQIDAQNAYNQYLMDAMKAANDQLKNWDFGNGYSVQALPNGQAAYYKNGKVISAGEFLEGTGAYGARWDIWNDIWNNGISTNGVGSDTVEAFNRYSPNDSKYRYLY